MAAHSDRAIERAYDQIAEDYARRGYRVSRTGAVGAIPDFLRDHQPDLIAERPDDHVVIEVKRTRSLRGANDLRQLAEEIAAHPGWRLELVALGKDADELAELAEPNWLDAALRLPDRIAEDPETRTYFVVYQSQLLETLLHGLALLARLRPRGKSAPRIAQELAFHGVIDQGTLTRIEQAIEWRNAFVHGRPLPRTSDEERTDLSALCRDLHARVRREAALTQEA
jgi:hypothetical protein